MAYLPPNVAHIILERLSFEDKQNGMLVDKAWNEAFYMCSFWKDILVTVTPANVDHVCKTLKKVKIPIENMTLDGDDQCMERVLKTCTQYTDLFLACAPRVINSIVPTIQSLTIALQSPCKLNVFSPFANLRTLDVSYSTHTEIDLLEMHHLPNALEQFTLEGNFKMLSMMHMCNLQALRLSNEDFALVLDLSKFPNLTELDLHAPKIHIVGSSSTIRDVIIDGWALYESPSMRGVFPKATSMVLINATRGDLEGDLPCGLEELIVHPMLPFQTNALDFSYMTKLGMLNIKKIKCDTLRLPSKIQDVSIVNSFVRNLILPYNITYSVGWISLFIVDHEAKKIKVHEASGYYGMVESEL